MNFFDQNSAPAISGNLANYAFRSVAVALFLNTYLAKIPEIAGAEFGSKKFGSKFGSEFGSKAPLLEIVGAG